MNVPRCTTTVASCRSTLIKQIDLARSARRGRTIGGATGLAYGDEIHFNKVDAYNGESGANE